MHASYFKYVNSVFVCGGRLSVLGQLLIPAYIAYLKFKISCFRYSFRPLFFNSSVQIRARMQFRMNHSAVTVAVVLLVCRYSSAQGGCSPAPPNTLISSGPSSALRSNNVPNILTAGVPATLFRVVVGGHGTDPWAVFSEIQVRQHGLWCQVQQSNTNNMAEGNIGDWYYPTPSGPLALNNINNDGTPYQELKCDNQVGLVVDGEIMNNQGITRCTTNITALTSYSGVSIDTNYLGVYEDSVINTIRNGE